MQEVKIELTYDYHGLIQTRVWVDGEYIGMPLSKISGLDDGFDNTDNLLDINVEEKQANIIKNYLDNMDEYFADSYRDKVPQWLRIETKKNYQ